MATRSVSRAEELGISIVRPGDVQSMANKVLIQEFDGTPAQITFRDVTDFNPTAANDLRHASAVDVEVQLDLTSLVDAAARQSALEFASGVAAGDTTYFYWAPSQHATAANGNPGNVSGSDAAYTGYSSNLSDSLYHLQFIGAVRATAQITTVIQVAEIGVFSPTERYGSLVVVAGDDLHSDAVEMHVVFDPIVDEVQ